MQKFYFLLAIYNPERMRMEPRMEIHVTGSCRKSAEAIMVVTGDR